MYLFSWAAAIATCWALTVGGVIAEPVGLELSTDLGRTWQPHNAPLDMAPPSALLRVANTSSPTIELPQCALTSPLNVFLWHDSDTTTAPFALSFRSRACEPVEDDDTESMLSVDPVITTFRRPRELRPKWWTYQTVRLTKKKVDEEVVMEKAWYRQLFDKYGLYIMMFVGVALGQGIRKGLAELKEEAEREEEAAVAARRRQPPTEQVRVVVPRTKKTVRSRKKAAAMAAAS